MAQDSTTTAAIGPSPASQTVEWTRNAPVASVPPASMARPDWQQQAIAGAQAGQNQATVAALPATPAPAIVPPAVPPQPLITVQLPPQTPPVTQPVAAQAAVPVPTPPVPLPVTVPASPSPLQTPLAPVAPAPLPPVQPAVQVPPLAPVTRPAVSPVINSVPAAAIAPAAVPLAVVSTLPPTPAMPSPVPPSPVQQVTPVAIPVAALNMVQPVIPQPQVSPLPPSVPTAELPSKNDQPRTSWLTPKLKALETNFTNLQATAEDIRPTAVVKVVSSLGIEYAMMTLTLWLSTFSLFGVLLGLTSSGHGFSVLALPIATLIVCLPICRWFFLRLKKMELEQPQLRSDPSKRRFSQLTQLIAFAVCLCALIAGLYSVLVKISGQAGLSIFKTILDVVVVVAVAGAILLYYWIDEHRKS